MSESNTFNRILDKAERLVERGVDKRIRIAVTGLSGAGKSAFITSFINQLVHISDNDQLPFFKAAKEGRIIASKITAYDEMHVPEFKYRQSLESMLSDTPSWPPSTTGVSQSQINIRYRVKHEWLKRVQKQSTLTIDIVDYPGEWLLDLPLLRLSFKEWSKQCYSIIEKGVKPPKSDWKEVTGQLLYQQPLSDEEITRLSNEYKAFVEQNFHYQQTYNLIQPGRFLLPGDLKGAPVLDFFPILDSNILQSDWSSLDDKCLLRILEKRFNYYKKEIVQPFFKEYFEKVDRQILLVDCLEVLNSGFQSFQNMQFTLVELLKSFHYGQSNWLKRLFNPTIDKLLIAATKADHVPPEQHRQLEGFLNLMLQEAKSEIQYEGIEIETLAISSVKVTEPVIAEHEGKKLMCVKGIELQTGEEVVNYPGKLIFNYSNHEKWDEHRYDFVNFAIPKQLTHNILPHIRMDKVLQFLIGDKFR